MNNGRTCAMPASTWSDQHTVDVVAARRATAARHDNALPPLDPHNFGINGAVRAPAGWRVVEMATGALSDGHAAC